MSLHSRWKALAPLWNVLSPRRRKQLIGLQMLSLLAALGEVANLGAILPLLRLLANPTEGLKALGPLAMPLQALPQQHLLLSLGLGFMMVVVLSSSLRMFTIGSQLRLAALISADIGERVFASVLQRPYSWHIRTNSSEVITYLTQDVGSVFACVQAFLLLGMNAVIVLMLGGSLIALAPEVMLSVALLLTVFYLLVFRYTRAGLRTDGALQLQEYQRAMKVAQEGLGGIRDILLDRSQATFLQAYRQSNLRQKLAVAAINIKAQVPRYLIEGFAMLLIVGLSLTLALQGKGIEQQLPLLGTLSLGAYRLLQPLQQCFGAVSGLQANIVALQRLDTLVHQQPEPQAFAVIENLPKAVSANQPLLQLCGVSFRYNEEGPWVIQDMNLAIHRGERLAFVGTTGCGKSTTSDLILALLEPSEGTLILEGQDLHRTAGLVEDWQARVAHVPQQIYLSDASFAKNIAFGVPEPLIDLSRVRQAAEQAKIGELIESSPHGYATLVGERGVRLSGGQRQRIGIARALYKQAQLLVLDEATSALDNRTEAEVMAAVEALDRKITVVFIAHRLSTVKTCDRIVVLHNGRIWSEASYLELERNDPVFQSLIRPPLSQ
jgi:ATP-binding cassette, subfamily B, bacterial PglK